MHHLSYIHLEFWSILLSCRIHSNRSKRGQIHCKKGKMLSFYFPLKNFTFQNSRFLKLLITLPTRYSTKRHKDNKMCQLCSHYMERNENYWVDQGKCTTRSPKSHPKRTTQQICKIWCRFYQWAKEALIKWSLGLRWGIEVWVSDESGILSPG